MALTVTVTEFKPVDRNSLKGFATVRIAELSSRLPTSPCTSGTEPVGPRCRRSRTSRTARW